MPPLTSRGMAGLYPLTCKVNAAQRSSSLQPVYSIYLHFFLCSLEHIPSPQGNGWRPCPSPHTNTDHVNSLPNLTATRALVHAIRMASLVCLVLEMQSLTRASSASCPPLLCVSPQALCTCCSRVCSAFPLLPLVNSC